MVRPKAAPLPCNLKPVTVRIPEAHKERLKDQAARQGVTLAELMRGQFYQADDPAETICDAVPRLTLHAPYIEKRKLSAAEQKKVADAMRQKARAEADKKRAEAAAARAERDRLGAQKAVERAHDKASQARSRPAQAHADKEAQAAQKAAQKATEQRDKAVQEASIAKAQVREAVQDANAVLVPAGHDPLPVPSDCKACGKPPAPSQGATPSKASQTESPPSVKKAKLIPTHGPGGSVIWVAEPVAQPTAQQGEGYDYGDGDDKAVGEAIFALPGMPASQAVHDQADEDSRIAAAIQGGIQKSLDDFRRSLGL